MSSDDVDDRAGADAASNAHDRSELPAGVRPRARALAERRARRAGLDLDTLRTGDPGAFAALHAEDLLVVDARLVPYVDPVLENAFAGVALYRVDGPGRVRILALPFPAPTLLAEADDVLARWVTTVPPELHAFYRIVSEPTGDVRELGLPIDPARWTGGAAWVGPFDDEASAEAWSRRHVGRGWIGDTLAYRGTWFCDVFSAHDGWLDARGGGGT